MVTKKHIFTPFFKRLIANGSLCSKTGAHLQDTHHSDNPHHLSHVFYEANDEDYLEYLHEQEQKQKARTSHRPHHSSHHHQKSERSPSDVRSN